MCSMLLQSEFFHIGVGVLQSFVLTPVMFSGFHDIRDNQDAQSDWCMVSLCDIQFLPPLGIVKDPQYFWALVC